MSKPSFSNIDLWLFELAEGNLNPQQVEELRVFLLKHPELDVEKDVWEMAKVQPSGYSYPDLASLEKKEPKRVYYAIGSVAALLLLFVGCYQYYGTLKTNDIRIVDSGVRGESVSVRSNLSNKKSNSFNSVGYSASSSISEAIKSAVEIGILSNESLSHLMSSAIVPTTLFGVDERRHLEYGTLAVNDIELINENVQELRRKEFFKLKTYPTQTIGQAEADKDLWVSKKSTHIPTRSYSSEYKESFRSKFKKAMTNVERMFNNPIALKNYRDPHYHVPGKTANEINFSSAGTMLRTRVQTLSRMQWYGEQNEQLMNVASVDGYVYGMRGGIGLQLKNSIYNQGGLNSYEAAFTYSPKLSVNHAISIEPSMRFKMGMKSLSKTKMENVNGVELDRGNMISYNSPQGSNLWYRDLGLGLMVNTKWFFAGAQVDNIFGHKDNMYGGDLGNPRRAGQEFIATAGVDWESRKENMMLSPYVIYMNKENISDVWVGMNYRFHWLTVGAAVSDKLEPAGSIGLKFDRFSLIYNADYLKSTLTGKQMLSHQLSVRIMSKPNRYGRKLLNL